MVHALSQLHRAIRPGGIVADLRPDRYARPRQPRPHLPKIYWASDGRERFQGILDKVPENLRKHRAATRAVKQVLERGVFLLKRTETFPFRYHFRNLSVFERWLSTGWKESILRRSVHRRLQMAQKRSRAGQIVVVEPLRLNVLRKPRVAG
jgi:hypothetical protein